jgi:hypothetical protein
MRRKEDRAGQTQGGKGRREWAVNGACGVANPPQASTFSTLLMVYVLCMKRKDLAAQASRTDAMGLASKVKQPFI